MPRETFPGGIRTIIARHNSIATAAATVSADFNANTLATIAGGAGGYVVGQKGEVCAFRFRVGDADFAGAGGTLTFELRRDSATGAAIATLTVPLATALRGAVIEGTLNNIEGGKLRDNDKLFIVRLATGTVFTTGAGTFEVEAWVKPQARR
jgi:hypothetical protein